MFVGNQAADDLPARQPQKLASASWSELKLHRSRATPHSSAGVSSVQRWRPSRVLLRGPAHRVQGRSGPFLPPLLARSR
eukprot:3666139-Pyramimonas_sp.AAC.1